MSNHAVPCERKVLAAPNASAPQNEACIGCHSGTPSRAGWLNPRCASLGVTQCRRPQAGLRGLSQAVKGGLPHPRWSPAPVLGAPTASHPGAASSSTHYPPGASSGRPPRPRPPPAASPRRQRRRLGRPPPQQPTPERCASRGFVTAVEARFGSARTSSSVWGEPARICPWL